jgi:transmembrane sensor
MRAEITDKECWETAAAWHDRLHRETVSEAARREFAAWLAKSPEHVRVYEGVEKSWTTLEKSALDPGILALRHETALRLTRQASEAIRPLRWAAAATIAGLLVAGATLVMHPAENRTRLGRLVSALQPHKAGDYATATGEHLSLTLSDGSQVTLDTESELQVAFTPAERTVHLVRGQAYFEVAKDHARPFVVEAQNRRFVAVGTAFDVRVDGEQVKVTMVEGTVRVEGREEPAIAVRQKSSSEHTGRAASALASDEVNTIRAGQQFVADASLNGDQVRAADPERSTSWRHGQIIFDNTRLADALVEINRYCEAKIELGDPALADLRLSGAFATERPSVFVEAITTYFPVQISRADDHAIVLTTKK